MVEPEDIVSGEWADWYRLSSLERRHASGELWEHYLSIGGSLDPEPDRKVLATMAAHRVRALLMGGQACVFCGAVEFSRDTMLRDIAYAGH